MTSDVAGPDGYELLDEIGRGASSRVYKAVQRSTGRTVALKVLGDGLGADDVYQLFERERRALAVVAGHPRIVSILDAGVWDGSPWIAMDYCPQSSYAVAGVAAPVADALVVLRDVGDALAGAHAGGVLHCDVKPANIMRAPYGGAALSDFGIAKLVVASRSGSAASSYTLDHVAPEVLEGDTPGPAADVYSLATSAWEMLAGRPPFRLPTDTSVAPVMDRIRRGALPRLDRPDVPVALHELIAAMADRQPTARPTAAIVRDVADALARGVEPPPWQATRQVPPHQPPPNQPYAGMPAANAGMTSVAAPGGRIRDHAEPAPDWGSVTGAPTRRWALPVASVVAVLVLAAGVLLWAPWRDQSTTAAPTLAAASGLTPSAAAATDPTRVQPTPVVAPAPIVVQAPPVVRAPVRTTEQAPAPAPVTAAPITRAPTPTTTTAAPTLVTLQIRGNCSMSSDGYCHALGSPVTYYSSVKDSNGNRPTDGCLDQSILTDSSGSRPVGSVTCNSSSPLASLSLGPGTYKVQETVTYLAKTYTSQVFYLSVDS